MSLQNTTGQDASVVSGGSMEAKGTSDVKLQSLSLLHHISIAAVSWARNQLDIFGLGTNNEMFHKW
jgi:hypothetical protein